MGVQHTFTHGVVELGWGRVRHGRGRVRMRPCRLGSPHELLDPLARGPGRGTMARVMPRWGRGGPGWG